MEDFNMDDKYYKILMKLCQKAMKKQEVPVSAIIVKNNKIIAAAYNTRNRKKSVLNHAEVLAISKASKQLKDWRLDDCELYVTLKPCSMCESIIKQSRIKKVTYLLNKIDNKKEYYKTEIAQANIRTQEEAYSAYLKAFFQKQRDKH